MSVEHRVGLVFDFLSLCSILSVSLIEASAPCDPWRAKFGEAAAMGRRVKEEDEGKEKKAQEAINFFSPIDFFLFFFLSALCFFSFAN